MAVPNLWRTKKQRYSLQGDVCVHCAQMVFPPREVCPHCNKPMQRTSAKPAAPAFAFAPAQPQPVLAAVAGDD